jgi:hypothetical protein
MNDVDENNQILRRQYRALMQCVQTSWEQLLVMRTEEEDIRLAATD